MRIVRKCQRHTQADAPMFIMEVNEEKYTGKETVLSAGSCTTNSLTPLIKRAHEKFGIVEAMMATIHLYTTMQKTFDDPSKKYRMIHTKNSLLVRL